VVVSCPASSGYYEVGCANSQAVQVCKTYSGSNILAGNCTVSSYSSSNITCLCPIAYTGETKVLTNFVSALGTQTLASDLHFLLAVSFTITGGSITAADFTDTQGTYYVALKNTIKQTLSLTDDDIKSITVTASARRLLTEHRGMATTNTLNVQTVLAAPATSGNTPTSAVLTTLTTAINNGNFVNAFNTNAGGGSVLTGAGSPAVVASTSGAPVSAAPTPAPTVAPPTEASSSSSTDNTSTIIGIAVGVGGGVLVLGIVGMYFARRNNGAKNKVGTPPDRNQPVSPSNIGVVPKGDISSGHKGSTTTVVSVRPTAEEAEL